MLNCSNFLEIGVSGRKGVFNQRSNRKECTSLVDPPCARIFRDVDSRRYRAGWFATHDFHTYTLVTTYPGTKFSSHDSDSSSMIPESLVGCARWPGSRRPHGGTDSLTTSQARSGRNAGARRLRGAMAQAVPRLLMVARHLQRQSSTPSSTGSSSSSSSGGGDGGSGGGGSSALPPGPPKSAYHCGGPSPAAAEHLKEHGCASLPIWLPLL
eukprot:SAG31_NODE_2355_length_5879_cov_6.732526_5_plen_211_part_00